MTDALLGVSLIDVVDMVVVAVLFGSVMVLMRRTRAWLALTGFAFLGIVDLVAQQIGLQVTAGMPRARRIIRQAGRFILSVSALDRSGTRRAGWRRQPRET